MSTDTREDIVNIIFLNLFILLVLFLRLVSFVSHVPVLGAIMQIMQSKGMY